MKSKDRHQISIETAKSLIFGRSEYSYGFFEFHSLKSGTSYELKLTKSTRNDGFINFSVYLLDGGSSQFVGRYFKGGFYGKSYIEHVEIVRRDLIHVLHRLENGDPDKLAEHLAIFHHGVCLICGRRLKTRKSVLRGIGSTCEMKL